MLALRDPVEACPAGDNVESPYEHIPNALKSEKDAVPRRASALFYMEVSSCLNAGTLAHPIYLLLSDIAIVGLLAGSSAKQRITSFVFGLNESLSRLVFRLRRVCCWLLLLTKPRSVSYFTCQHVRHPRYSAIFPYVVRCLNVIIQRWRRTTFGLTIVGLVHQGP